MTGIPIGAAHIIRLLETSGFEAWAVGGCVRDSLLGLAPNDWDICTSAKPQQTVSIFQGHRVIETGIKHGTVTVLYENESYEVTTYRTDGVYSDSRRPDSVDFVTHVQDDLSRRDFTVNAMAYHPERGLYDAFGGEDDLKNKIIRCVGDAKARFEEDALRILRAMRFASTFGFAIEEKTAQAILDCKERLRLIAPERIREELLRLLTGAGAADILRAFAPVLDVFLPELASMRGHYQYNPHHYLDVWEHTLAAVAAAPQDPILRLTMLLHDSGKPACFFKDAKGVGHFYGHPEVSLKITKAIMDRLRFDNDTKKAVEELVLHHDATIPAKPKNVLKWLNRIGETRLMQLLPVKRADAAAQHPDKREAKLGDISRLEACIKTVINQGLPYRLKDLAVTGDDLIAIGIPPGKQVGNLLQELLKRVMEGRLANEKHTLRAAAEKMYASGKHSNN